MAYFTDIESHKTEEIASYTTRLQPDDLLGIVVNSKSEKLVSDFNRGAHAFSTSFEAYSTASLQTYLVDKEGYIDYPIIGKIKVSGLTREEFLDKLTQAIKPYITDVSVNLRILNYKIIVQGEVANPGVFTINSERVTILQALSLAGDLTIYGKRDRVLVIREQDNKRTFNVIDLTSSDFMTSDYYFLQQNDIVYVEPNKTKINSSTIGANTSTIFSTISVLLAVISLILR